MSSTHSHTHTSDLRPYGGEEAAGASADPSPVIPGVSDG